MASSPKSSRKRKHEKVVSQTVVNVLKMPEGPDKEKRIKENLEKLRKLKAETEKEALRVYKEVMPDDVARLNALFEKFKDKQLKNSVANKPAPADGRIEVPCNAYIEELYLELRREIMHMVIHFVKIRFWLQLKLPKYRTGNNMAAAVASELLSMLESGRVSGLSVLEIVAKYFLRRATLVQNFLKTPNTHVADKVREIADLDEKQFICLVQGAMGLRNTYALVFDKMEKNFDFIKRLDRADDESTLMTL
eukprot:g767.t1